MSVTSEEKEDLIAPVKIRVRPRRFSEVGPVHFYELSSIFL